MFFSCPSITNFDLHCLVMGFIKCAVFETVPLLAISVSM